MRYLTFDVFTTQAFGGNPLAVIPDARGLPEESFQRIAREFNYSETTFVLPPEDTVHTAHVRIFTPTREIPFAGHPLIGTAVALAGLGHGPEMVLELGIGPIVARAAGDSARFTTTARLDRMAEPPAEMVARCLGLDPDRLIAPPVQASLGLPFTFAELRDRQALADCRPDTDGFRAGAEAYPASMDFAVMAWTRTPDGLAARMFAPLDNIPEDPATGSACATLAALLGDGTHVIAQGEDMGRPSRIEVTVAGGDITVAGRAVPVMEGRLLTGTGTASA